MATPTSIRPVIGRMINATRSLPSTNAPFFLAILSTSSDQSCPFSTTPERSMRRPRRDNNRLRGLSSIYRSGPRFRMNVGKDEVPRPADFKPEVQVDADHGLWEFFYAKDKVALAPETDAEHGRGWTVEELRHKSWDDLHKLWWVCVKEQNRIATARKEKSRMQLQSGDEETAERLGEVRKTMKAIRHALTERFYLWEDARKLAETDPEIDLSSKRIPYTPSDDHYVEDVEQAEMTAEEAEALAGKPLAENVDPSTLPSKATEGQQPSARS